MTNSNRDILVLLRQDELSEKQMEDEVSRLNRLLFTAERLDNFVNAHELLDLNRYRVINDRVLIKKMLRRKNGLNPFVFFSNKN